MSLTVSLENFTLERKIRGPISLKKQFLTRKPGFRNTFVVKFDLVYLPEKFFVARGVRQRNRGKSILSFTSM